MFSLIVTFSTLFRTPLSLHVGAWEARAPLYSLWGALGLLWSLSWSSLGHLLVLLGPPWAPSGTLYGALGGSSFYAAKWLKCAF